MNGSKLGIAFVDPVAPDRALAQLAGAGLFATFFLSPERLVREAPRWMGAAAAGHELGNGALLGADVDGSLRNWRCASLEEELRAANKLLLEFGMASIESIYLPGRYHVCAEGSFRAKVRRSFAVCLSEAARACALDGEPGRLAAVRLPDGALAVAAGEPPEAPVDGWPAELAAAGAGPLRRLAKP